MGAGGRGGYISRENGLDMVLILEGQGGEFVLGGYKGHRISVTLYGTRV